MIFMGDIHGNIRSVLDCLGQLKQRSAGGTEHTIYLCILGDAAMNYFLDYRDHFLKKRLQERIEESDMKRALLLFVRGNHECRPENLSTYYEVNFCGGKAYTEHEFPNLIFLKDGELYRIEGRQYLVLGGGFSGDFFMRVLNGMKYWADEELSEKEQMDILLNLETRMNGDVCLLSHMLPSFAAEMLNGRHQVCRTELFLQTVWEKYKTLITAWYAGHYHLDWAREIGGTESKTMFHVLYQTRLEK